jgi:hypothetical protein
MYDRAEYGKKREKARQKAVPSRPSSRSQIQPPWEAYEKALKGEAEAAATKYADTAQQREQGPPSRLRSADFSSEQGSPLPGYHGNTPEVRVDPILSLAHRSCWLG